ncbi:hypothetical protein TNCV_908171 [Trichonephila clavipes]|nr:hypothetical protein TNCV_908171 [Trichonephila clavipes]
MLLLLRWIDGTTTTAREGCGSFARPGPPMKEGRFILGTFRSVRMRVRYRSRQDDRLRVMTRGHEPNPLKAKGDIEDVSSELDDGVKGCTSWMKRPNILG